MRRTIIAAIGIGIAIAMPAPCAAEGFPPAPAIVPPKPFTLPPAETLTLANGMRVTLIPYGVAPKAIVRLRIEAGAVDAGGDTALGLLAAAMLKEGAGTRDGAQIARAAADMGGDLSIGTGDRDTDIGVHVLSERVPEAIALIADIAQRPTWPSDAFARVKADRLRTLSITLSQAGPVADYALARTLYPGHPYGAVPDPARIGGYTLAQVRAFHDANVGARRAHLYLVGRFDAATARAAIERAFGGWAGGTPRRAAPAIARPGPQVIVVDRPGAPQSTVRVSFPVPLKSDPDEAKLEITDALLGGAFSSRITRNIREQKGYTYSPYSTLSFRPDTARWTQHADVTTADTGASLHEIWSEIARLRTAAPPAVEADAIKTYQAGLFTLRGSSSLGALRMVVERDALGLPAGWLDGYVPRLLRVSPAEITRTAHRRFDVDTQTLVVVGDLKTVLPQLRAQPELAGRRFETMTVP